MSKPETPCRWGCLPVGYRCSHYLDLPAPQAEAQPSDTPCALCGGPSGFAFDPPRPVLCVACRVKTTAEAAPAPKPAEPRSRNCRCAPGSFGVYCPQHGSTAPFLSPMDRAEPSHDESCGCRDCDPDHKPAPPAPKPEEPLMGVMQPYRQKPAPPAPKRKARCGCPVIETPNIEYVQHGDGCSECRHDQTRVDVPAVGCDVPAPPANVSGRTKHDIACLESKIGVERRAGEAAISELERLRDLIVRYRDEQDVYESVGVEGDGDIGVLDAQHDLLEEGAAIRDARAAREAGKA